jgi:glycosyltransferase involved in cell wall biosynthesis
VAGTPEEVIEGETGFLVQPGNQADLADRLIRLLSDEDLRVKMGQAGRKRAEEHFDNEVVCQRLIALWRSTISTGN